MTKITNRWTTICTVGYDATLAVERTEGNGQKARGGVCLCQARMSGKNGLRGRKVNTTGGVHQSHREIGYSFALTADELRHWESLSNSAK
jgi:hypothetical protein